MKTNENQMKVGGFLFENADEAQQALKEVEGIKYIRSKTDMDNPELVLQVYNKMVEQKLFETAVGYSYLKDLQEYLTTIPYIKNEDILSIPVNHKKLEESLKKQKIEIAQKERKRIAKIRQKEKQAQKETESGRKKKLTISVWCNFILAICIVCMFLITMTSDNPTIIDYQSKILDKYAAWEQELTERERAVTEKEQELGIYNENE